MDERTKKRTVFGLSREKPLDLFHLRRLTSLFKPLVDAEYGSATFITGATRAKLQLRVSTSGLLIRKSPEPIL